MTITAEAVRHVAELARLRIEPDAIETFARQLAAVLDYMQTLGQLDTSGVPATSHAVDAINAFRDDQPHHSLSRDEAIANAPDPRSGTFGVPKVITTE